MDNLANFEECINYSKFIGKSISDKTLRRLISRDVIIAEKIKGKVYIDKNSFISYLENKKTKPKKIKLQENEVNTELAISVDWFQVTFFSRKKEYFDEKELISIFTNLLNIESSDIKYLDKSYNSYQKALEYNDILLLYGDNTYNHCNLQIKGSGCDVVYKRLVDNNENWYNFFEKVNKLNGKVTRLDIAIDDYKPIFELEELEQKILNKEIVTKFKSFRFIKDYELSKDNLGMTIYLGSLKSEMFYRFYKKGVQLEKKKETQEEIEEVEKEEESVDFNRYEIVLKDKKANSIFKKLVKNQKLEDLAISLIHKNFNVYENSKLENYWTKWQEFIIGAKTFKFNIPIQIKTIERKKAWLQSQVATTLAEMIETEKRLKEEELVDDDYSVIDEILEYSNYENNSKDKERIDNHIKLRKIIQEEI